MKTSLLALPAAVAVLAACSSPPTTVDVSIDDVLNHKTITRDVSLAVGDTLKLSLGANHSTPYRWTPDPTIGDAAIMKQASHQYARPDTDKVGAPGAEVWTFTALKAGTTTIVTSYGNVTGDAPPTSTFTANITVR